MGDMEQNPSFACEEGYILRFPFSPLCFRAGVFNLSGSEYPWWPDTEWRGGVTQLDVEWGGRVVVSSWKGGRSGGSHCMRASPMPNVWLGGWYLHGSTGWYTNPLGPSQGPLGVCFRLYGGAHWGKGWKLGVPLPPGNCILNSLVAEGHPAICYS